MFNAKYLHINFMFTSAFERFQCFKRRILAGWVQIKKLVYPDKSGGILPSWAYPPDVWHPTYPHVDASRDIVVWHCVMVQCVLGKQSSISWLDLAMDVSTRGSRRGETKPGLEDCIIRSASILHLNSAALLIGCEQEFCWQIKLWCRKCCADASAVKPWTQLRKHLCTISLVCNAYQPLAALGRCEKPGKRALTKQAGRGGVSQARTMSWGNPPCHIPSLSPPSC